MFNNAKAENAGRQVARRCQRQVAGEANGRRRQSVM